MHSKVFLEQVGSDLKELISPTDVESGDLS